MGIGQGFQHRLSEDLTDSIIDVRSKCAISHIVVTLIYFVTKFHNHSNTKASVSIYKSISNFLQLHTKNLILRDQIFLIFLLHRTSEKDTTRKGILV